MIRRLGPLPAVAAVVAMVAVTGFRVGVLPGGLVGVSVALALVGAWLGRVVGDGAALRRRASALWRALWPPAVVALVVAVLWVLATPSTGRDGNVRGQAIALVGAHGNWQLLGDGPREVLDGATVTPLQHLWGLGVAAQCLALAATVWWLTRSRARRSAATVDPVAWPLLVLAALGLATAAALTAAGASGQTLLLATWGSGAALLGAAGLAVPGVLDRLRRPERAAAGAAVPLVVAAVVASPGSTVWTTGGAVVVPLLAALLGAAVVVAPGDAPSARVGASSVADRARATADVDDSGDADDLAPPVAAGVAWVVLHGAALAFAASVFHDLPTALQVAAGLVLAGSLVLGTVLVSDQLDRRPPAVERRRVLGPPLVAALLVVLLAVTGAFHWAGPHPRSGAAAEAR